MLINTRHVQNMFNMVSIIFRNRLKLINSMVESTQEILKGHAANTKRNPCRQFF